MRERAPLKGPNQITQPTQAAMLVWLLLGISLPLLFIFTRGPFGELELPIGPIVTFVVAIALLDCFVGASRSTMPLQRITPAVILGLLITPGVPLVLPIIADIVGTVLVVALSRLTPHLIAQVGKALLPGVVTAFYLSGHDEVSIGTNFIACEIFVLLSVLLRSDRSPFRSDIFLIVTYPAVALLLSYLAELNLTYLLLAIPLLFLLTSVNPTGLLSYFQLEKKFDETQSQMRQTRQAKRKTEIESQRRGVLLLRKEQQLALLNRLGREMESSDTAEDLGRFLLAESVRLTGADLGLLLSCPSGRGSIAGVLGSGTGYDWGVVEGQELPPNLQSTISTEPPWDAPAWRNKHSFLTCRLGREGWLVMARREKDAFPEFLSEFFTAVGRHAGSSILALRRLTQVRAVAEREAQAKRNEAREKEKVAEQNRKLRLLLETFEGLTKKALTREHLMEKASVALCRMTGADRVLFDAHPIEVYRRSKSRIEVEETVWNDHLFCRGKAASGHLLCLSQNQGTFSASQLEWCTALRDFLDNVLQNQHLQQEVVVTSQWAAAGRLAANAAHELNTPLGAIRIAAEHISMYLHGGGDPDPAIESMGSLMNSVDRCRKVTDRLLLTSRPVDRGVNPTKPEVQALGPIVEEALISMRPLLRASRVQLISPDPLPDYRCSVVVQDLYWAIVNLLKNSIDALNELNPPNKRITVEVGQSENHLTITVSDNGPGVAPEVQKRLFEPFFTTKKLGVGNGLGLSLSRDHLTRWGGSVEYLAESEGGATFLLKVPTKL